LILTGLALGKSGSTVSTRMGIQLTDKKSFEGGTTFAGNYGIFDDTMDLGLEINEHGPEKLTLEGSKKFGSLELDVDLLLKVTGRALLGKFTISNEGDTAITASTVTSYSSGEWCRLASKLESVSVATQAIFKGRCLLLTSNFASNKVGVKAECDNVPTATGLTLQLSQATESSYVVVDQRLGRRTDASLLLTRSKAKLELEQRIGARHRFRPTLDLVSRQMSGLWSTKFNNRHSTSLRVDSDQVDISMESRGNLAVITSKISSKWHHLKDAKVSVGARLVF